MMDIWKISDNYTLRLINIVLLALVLVGFYYGKKVITKRLRDLVSEKGITIQGKEFSINRLLNQVMIVVTIVLIYGAFVYGNEKFSLSRFLHFEFISRSKSGRGLSISLGQVIGVVVLIFATKITINILRILLHRAFKNKAWIDPGREYTIIQMSKYVLYTICLILILRIVFGDISNILLGASALFVGIGLGLQELFTDVVSGFILLNDGSIQVGDIVELEGHIAKIEKINIRTSHVRTTEGKTIIVPNSKFTEEYLTNWSVSDKITRFHIDVSVGYGTDTQLVKDLLYRAALSHPMVEKERPILVLFNRFGENGLEFQLYFWAKRSWDILIIKSDIRYEVDKLFRENNIKVPYPQRDLHIVSDRTKRE